MQCMKYLSLSHTSLEDMLTKLFVVRFILLSTVFTIENKFTLMNFSEFTLMNSVFFFYRIYRISSLMK